MKIQEVLNSHTGRDQIMRYYHFSDDYRLKSLKPNIIPGDPVMDIIISGCAGIENLEGCPGEINGSLMVMNCSNFNSAKGAPRKVGEVCSFTSLDKMKTLEGIPREIGKTLKLTGTRIESFSGIHEMIDHLPEIVMPVNYKGPILPILKINGLTKISIDKDEAYFYKHRFGRTPPAIKAVEILNQHLDSTDIISCKKDLISAGLSEFAKL